MAGRATDRNRIIGTMNADAFFIQTNPDDSNRIARTWLNDVIISAPSAVHQQSELAEYWAHGPCYQLSTCSDSYLDSISE